MDIWKYFIFLSSYFALGALTFYFQTYIWTILLCLEENVQLYYLKSISLILGLDLFQNFFNMLNVIRCR